MKNRAILASSLVLALAAAACGSSSTSNGTTTTSGTGGSTSSSTDTGTGGAGGGVMAPAASCIQAGEKGNDTGVGTFCTPGGGECSGFPKAGLCLADVGQDQWFCTRIGCKTDADCGMAAHCHLDPSGAACVPDKCEDASSTSSTGSTGSSSSSSSTGTGG